MTTLSDLIARLEAAKEGSRELDVAILTEVMGFRRVAENLFYGPKPEEWTYTLDGDGHPALPSPTRSLDAALMLVPANFVVSIHIGPGQIRHAAVGMYESRGATAALALCVAALKAREAER